MVDQRHLAVLLLDLFRGRIETDLTIEKGLVGERENYERQKCVVLVLFDWLGTGLLHVFRLYFFVTKTTYPIGLSLMEPYLP